ncbi:hypothetical protein N752_01165 [Desulforamulus aquiferis]|nr:type II secretion system F family protein [Desulforamulus aquiferis]RYD07225.1 hypothetical protein N752_01165 [Desulforamulus aquiferis]
MWSNSIRAGATLSQAISASISRVKPEIREELEYIQHDINLGDTTPKALENALQRIPVIEFRIIVMTARIHAQLGGNLAESLDNIADTIEDRLSTRENLKAYTTQARLGSAVAGLMPFGVLAFLRIASPEYLKPMVESDIGLAFLMLSVVLVFLGWHTIRKMGEANPM